MGSRLVALQARYLSHLRRCEPPLFTLLRSHHQSALLRGTVSPTCARYRFAPPRRPNSSMSMPSTTQAIPAQTDEQTSLAWVQLHDQSPASYGILIASGYNELIPFGVPLPYSRTEKLETTFDYLRGVTFEICYRKSIIDPPLEIATLDLTGIRLAKKGVPKMKITLSLDKDLAGYLRVQDTFTKSMASTTFDGGMAFRSQRGVEVIRKS